MIVLRLLRTKHIVLFVQLQYCGNTIEYGRGTHVDEIRTGVESMLWNIVQGGMYLN